jgi:hypothetical protein
MKRFFAALMLLILLVFVSTVAGAEFPFWPGYQFPFLYPMSFWGALPPLLPVRPYFSFGMTPRNLFPVLAPPAPMLRQARATVTIFFNPALSVIQVTVLPLTPVAPVVPVVPTAVVAPTTAIAPAIAPSALLLLPLLSGLGGTQPNLNFNSTSTVATPAPVPVVNSTSTFTGLTGLTALLPLI